MATEARALLARNDGNSVAVRFLRSRAAALDSACPTPSRTDRKSPPGLLATNDGDWPSSRLPGIVLVQAR